MTDTWDHYDHDPTSGVEHLIGAAPATTAAVTSERPNPLSEKGNAYV